MSPTDDVATIGHLEKTLGAIKRETMAALKHLHLLTRIENGLNSLDEILPLFDSQSLEYGPPLHPFAIPTYLIHLRFMHFPLF